MKKIILLFLLILPFSSYSEDNMIPVVIDSDEITYSQEAGEVIAKGNVVMQYKDVTLYCQEAHYNANKNIAKIVGDAKIERGKTILYSKDLIYDFSTYDADTQDIRISDPPVYGRSQSGSKVGKDKYVLEKGYATTCDLEKPHYRLTAKKITVYPGDKVVAKNVVFKVGNFPLAFIPYFSQSLKDKSFIAEVTPGKDGDWGYYLLTRWRYNLNPENKGKIMLDWYEKRGQALGLVHKMESDKYGKALINIYGLHDKLYEEENRDEFLDDYPERSGINSKYLEDDRYKLQFAYSADPTDNLSIRSEFNKFSDPYFMKDFFEREYDNEPHPLSYNLIKYSLSNSALSLFTQKRANVFWDETEYLPQLEYDFFDQEIADSQFYFKSQNLLGNLSQKVADTRIGDEAFRGYSQNVLTYTDRIKWLSITPYIGSYTTYYSRNEAGDDGVLREALTAGTTLNTKLYKTFAANLDFLGIKVDEMRHILTPEVSFSYIHDPTVSNDNIYQFDEYDDLSREAKVVFSLANKLQARNSTETWDFLYFSPAVEYRIDDEGEGSHFDRITADFELYPRKGLSLTSDIEYDVDSHEVSEANVDFTISDTAKVIRNGEEVDREKYSFSYGHRYTSTDEAEGTFGSMYQINPKLRYNNYLRYEYDTGRIEEQQHSFRIDLHCWWLDLGISVDKQTTGVKDYTFWFMFTLKAFPDVHVDFDRGYQGAKSEY